MIKNKPGYTVAILGATGAVGKETLDILEERKFPLMSLRLFASKRSAGEVMTCQDKEWKVEELTDSSSFEGVDVAFISATDAISREYGQRLGAAGIAVIDDSAVYRMDEGVPLVVPEVNASALHDMPRGIVSIPNCTTTPLVMALKPTGRLFVVVGKAPVMDARLVERTGENDWRSESLFETELAPLLNVAEPTAFSF